MRKWLLSGLLISGLVLAYPTATFAEKPACSKCQSQYSKRSKCSKCESKAKKCQITKLKKKVKVLWDNKEDLGLKDRQLDEIKEIKRAAIKKLIQLKADKKIVLVDLKSAKYEDEWDIEAINGLIDAKYAAKKDTAKTFVKAIADIRQILTEDQIEQWKELCKKCGKGHKFCPLTGKPLKKK